MGCESVANDIHWQQQFSNDEKSLGLLDAFGEPPAPNKCEHQGPIKVFEYIYELAGNILHGARRLILIEAGETQILMNQGHNLASHIYNLAAPYAIVEQLLLSYLPCSLAFRLTLVQPLRQEGG